MRNSQTSTTFSPPPRVEALMRQQATRADGASATARVGATLRRRAPSPRECCARPSSSWPPAARRSRPTRRYRRCSRSADARASSPSPTANATTGSPARPSMRIGMRCTTRTRPQLCGARFSRAAGRGTRRAGGLTSARTSPSPFRCHPIPRRRRRQHCACCHGPAAWTPAGAPQQPDRLRCINSENRCAKFYTMAPSRIRSRPCIWDTRSAATYAGGPGRDQCPLPSGKGGGGGATTVIRQSRRRRRRAGGKGHGGGGHHHSPKPPPPSPSPPARNPSSAAAAQPPRASPPPATICRCRRRQRRRRRGT